MNKPIDCVLTDYISTLRAEMYSKAAIKSLFADCGLLVGIFLLFVGTLVLSIPLLPMLIASPFSWFNRVSKKMVSGGVL